MAGLCDVVLSYSRSQDSVKGRADPGGLVAGAVRYRVHVRGLVQGVGFRPFVWRSATSLGLTGWVGNDAAGVVLEVEGEQLQVQQLLDALHDPPALARVTGLEVVQVCGRGGAGFAVRDSDLAGPRSARIAPDTATCDDCLRELRDPTDRRYGYPFTNCTACGPRLTIVESVPYDRARTTMAAFPLCGPCRREYEDPADRRFHAEPVACPDCGPRLSLDVSEAARRLLSGEVLAVKGIGGYHLAADATDEAAVRTLRRRKRREDRPFAVMVADLGAARALCHVDVTEQALLTGPARPVVLLARREGAPVAPSVSAGLPTLGVLLPYAPLHHLLLEACGVPLVMTSGNASDEPIAVDGDDAVRRLSGLADAFVHHDRAIRLRVDDSVVKVVAGRPVPVRRSRGHVPTPVLLAGASPRAVLACGAGLKSTFCLVRGDQAFLSPHLGDLAEPATWTSYLDVLAHLERLLGVVPEVLAHDLHPGYPSTAWALDQAAVELVGVQHHHAHIASCLTDNGAAGPVIGVAFDGLGLGTDGTLWGGEVLVADLVGFERVAHLEPVPMPGGDAAARQPWRMAAAHLQAAGVDPRGLQVHDRNAARWDRVLAGARAGVNAPPTSSAGRLFDAVASLVGVRDAVTYEGQAAVELEHLADPAERQAYALPYDGGVLRVGVLVREVVEDVRRGTAAPVVSARFHNALAAGVTAVCARLRAERGLTQVALSGGCFQNGLLLTRCVESLEPLGFLVLTHREVPCNDGGISLGQAAAAVARLRAGR